MEFNGIKHRVGGPPPDWWRIGLALALQAR